MTQPSDRYLLIQERLREPLAEYVAKRRPSVSWRIIARELWQRTEIDVSYEQLRQWFPEDRAAAPADRAEAR